MNAYTLTKLNFNNLQLLIGKNTVLYSCFHRKHIALRYRLFNAVYNSTSCA